ncbi:unnamed protein product [Zymoseptoria tritici ST99CH_1A5]|uniref:Major facilitator superfamily (MFS) profile domain-containing protein n=1 Tax=Zymoseptoria tritici ST99CH_1A5 TaxID=1276529 RepID=A0A1Y6LQB0_ZYMTR|nr:unnamed protein product [Zymoseptoria tritici ST99CH_3D1]SMY24801.1 unnamed protein product [Zymoseptoria tritici ST99CH_1A5]
MATAQSDFKRAEEDQVSHAEWLVNARDATAREHDMGIRNALKRYPKAALWSLAMSSTIIMEGYDTMLMGNFFAQPAFKTHYGQRTAKGKYEIPAPWQAGLNNSSSCGQLIGLLLAGHISERFGFRKTMLGGLALASAFIFLQFFAPSLEILLVAQILFGIPLGLFQTVPIVYAAEIAPVSLRPYLTNYINFCWAIGHLIGSGILRGSLQIDGRWAYRVPFALQWFWPLVLIPTLFFAPENPWWLVRQGRLAEAKDVLADISYGETDEDNDKSIALMVVTTEHERYINANTTYIACFKGTDLKRTLTAMGVYCVQTLSGNPLRSSSTYFMVQAGFSSTRAFDMTIVNYALALIGGFVSWGLLPLFGRRPTYFWTLVMMLALLIIIGSLGVAQVHSTNTAYSWTVAVALMISSFLYNAGMGPLTNTICSEVPSGLLRSKTVVLARWTYTALNIIAGTFTPYQLNPTAWNWGAKTGFFWAGGCLISVVFAFLYVPETKDRTAAEVDIMFERRVSPRRFKETAVDLVEAIDGKEIDVKL